MSDETQEIDAGDVAEVLEFPHREGRVPVTVPVAAGEATIWVPEGHTDHVTYEDIDGTKLVWENPAHVPTITEPGPDDDVMWDASVHAYVPRVRVAVAEGGSGVEAQQV